MNGEHWYSRLVRPALIIAAVGVLSKLLQGVAGILFADRFGAQEVTDAYLLAKSLPIGVYLVVDSVLYNALVPLLRKDDDSPGLASFRVTIVVLVGATALCAGVAIIALAGPIIRGIAPGAPPETLVLGAKLARLMGVGVMFALPSSLLKALNVCRGRYVLAALDAFVISGLLVAALIGAPAEGGIWAVAAALPGAMLVLLLVQAAAARREITAAPLAWRTPLMGQLALLSAPLAVVNLLHQVNLLVINAFLANTATGAVSWFHFSYNVAQVPVSIVDLVLLSTLFPFAAALDARGDLASLRIAYRAVARLVVLILVPCAVWLVLMRQEVVFVVFERGLFDRQATLGTSACLVGTGLAVMPWAFEMFACRCLFALRRHRTYAVIVGLRVMFNALLAWLFARLWGAQGVSAAFGTSYLLGALLAAAALRSSLKIRGGWRETWSMGWRAALGAAAVAAVWGVVRLTTLPGSGFDALLRLTIVGVGGCAAVALVYGLLWFTRNPAQATNPEEEREQ